MHNFYFSDPFFLMLLIDSLFLLIFPSFFFKEQEEAAVFSMRFFITVDGYSWARGGYFVGTFYSNN